MENQNINVNDTVEDKVEGGATESNTVEVKEEKTFTQAELDKILNKKFAQWQKKTEEEKKEAERKAKLSEEERFAEERKEFEAERKQFEYEKRVNSTSKVLASNNLPIEFADFLIAEDDEATTQRVDLFKSAFNEAVEREITQRLRGTTPKTSTAKSLEITKEQFRKMSLVKQAELKRTKPELYKELTKR